MDSDAEEAIPPGSHEPSQRRRHRRSWLYRKLRHFKLVRIFRKDRPFAFIFAVGAVIALAVGVAVPRFWDTAPETFPRGPINVSLVDLIQARSLARSARAAAAAGQIEVAIHAWRSAIANNRGDARLPRGLLESLRDFPEFRPDHGALALDTAAWLLALTGTNLADVILVADVFERYGQPRSALARLAKVDPGSSDAAAKVRARCLFSAGSYDEFERLWRTNQATWSADPLLARYQDAWRVATDDRSGGLESALRLKQALEVPGGEGLIAARLLHQAAARRGLADEVALCVRRLESARSASVAHYAHVWRLLAASGNYQEATNLAVKLEVVPRDPESAVQLIEALRFLGLREKARRFCEENMGVYGASTEVWRSYFDLLVEIGNWKEVRRAGVEARVLASRNDPLWVEALFAEYRAEHGEERRRKADEVVEELLSRPLAEPGAALRLATQWRLDARPEPALAVLKSAEGALGESPEFWAEYFQVGLALRDVELLRRSVEELLRLRPDSPAWVNNRAALLLITGESSAEALQLTFEGLRRQPESRALQVNHAMALQRNGRTAEAARLLERMPADRLSPDFAASYHLAMAEVRLAEGRREEAVAAAGRVERSRLLPPQIERLDRVLAGR